MKTLSWTLVLAPYVIALFVSAGATAQTLQQVKLKDELDRPGEGYCIDILGVGPSARVDLPLVVHNCLTELNRTDRHAVFSDNRIAFPTFDLCVTAFGVVSPLPGAPVLLRSCGTSESFLPADSLQKFVRTDVGRLELEGTGLCLTVGGEAARTFSRSDRWRTLTMERCSTAPLQLSVWE